MSQVARNLGEYLTGIYKMESYLDYMNGTSIFMLHWCCDYATSLRQKGTKLRQVNKTETKLRQKEQN